MPILSPHSQYLLPHDYEPSDMDIVCGRGKACAKHAGNKKFKAQVFANLKRYADTPKRTGKSLVVSSVVKTLFESGLRFIKLDEKHQRYHELSRDQAHDKTGHSIRDFLNRTAPAINSRRQHFARRQSPSPLFKCQQRIQTFQPEYSEMLFSDALLSSIDNTVLLPLNEVVSAEFFEILDEGEELQRLVTPDVADRMKMLSEEVESVDAVDILDQILGELILPHRPEPFQRGVTSTENGVFDLPSLLGAPLPIDCDWDKQMSELHDPFC